MVVTFREHPGAEPVDLKAWSTPSSIAPAAAHLDQVPDAVTLPQGDPEATPAGAGCTEELKAEQPRPALPPISVNEIGVIKEIMALYRHITNTKPDKAEPPGPAKSAREEVEGVEVPDDGPRQAAWMSCYDVENYLVHGDERERVLASRMLEVLYETIGHIELVVKSRTEEAGGAHGIGMCDVKDTPVQHEQFGRASHQGRAAFHQDRWAGGGLAGKDRERAQPCCEHARGAVGRVRLHMSGLFRRLVEYLQRQELIARDFEADDRIAGRPTPLGFTCRNEKI